MERPYRSGGGSTYTEPAPLQAIEAAVFTRNVAAGRARHYAQRARGDGHGWDVIGEALGLTEQAKHEQRGRGELAFEMVAGAPPMRFDRVTCHWTCSTCGEFVTDNGPYNPHPEDQEEGHAADCSRFRQAVSEYEATTRGVILC